MTKEDLLNQFFDLWNNVEFENEQEMNLSFYSKAVNKYAEMNNQYVNIYSFKQKKIVALSNNHREVLGYDVSTEDYINNGKYYFVRDLPVIQSSIFLQFSYIYLSKIKSILKVSDNLDNIYMYFHNFQLKHKNTTKHLGIYATALNIKQTKDIDLVLVINSDISHLVKDPSLWWCNLAVENDLYFSGHKERLLVKEKHIFSKKEKDILMLLARGNSNLEIVEKLGISSSTLEKHRNNLLEWTGAKDITTLLQIVKFGNLLI
jgi:DNA-binding CsgD family transcriptional regulator